MTSPTTDRLYKLLPYLYRLRDAERGHPLRAFLRVVEEQADVLESDLDRLYDNWFIETCDEAMVPYLGELVGWETTARAGEPGEAQGAEGMLLRRTLAARADVARTLAHRRRKGTLPLLEELARVVAGWPARAVESYRLLSYTQPLNHQRPERGRTVDLRDAGALARLGGPFERTAHTVDVRRPTSALTRGRHNIPSVGVFVWRLRSWPITACNAYLQEGIDPREYDRHQASSARQRGCFHFNILGIDTPLFAAPAPEPDPHHIAEPENVPDRLTRRALAADLARHYGPDRALCVWLGTDGASSLPAHVPVEQVAVADLTEWACPVPRDKTVVVDPELGRFKVRVALPPGARVTSDDLIGGARVSYRYGFGAAMGGGEYDRELLAPTEAHTLYVVGPGAGQCPTLAAALDRWRREAPARAIIEMAARTKTPGPVRVNLAEGQTLILRAADRHRAVLWLVDERPDGRDDFAVAGEAGSRFELDGFLVAGRGLSVCGPLDEVVIRHCTLLSPERAEGRRRDGPAARLSLDGVAGDVRVERSVVGPIAVTHDGEPTRVAVVGSVLDAGDAGDDAFGDGPRGGFARASLTVRGSTVFGRVTTHALTLAENSLFTGAVRVARRGEGCVRFCYVPDESRTPKRFRCQPETSGDPARVRPVWESRRYGTPTYAQLWRGAAPEVLRGADDRGEMGAFHDLYWPQREDALSQRLAEYVPVGVDAGIFFVT